MENLVIPRSFVVGMEEQVRVAFDHAGHHGFAGQVDYCCISGCWERGTDRFDFVTADQDGPTFVGLGIDAIEDARGLQKVCRICGRRRGPQRETQRRTEAHSAVPSDPPVRDGGATDPLHWQQVGEAREAGPEAALAMGAATRSNHHGFPGL